ncbi:MAG: Crp/Fnr family transcriptional regulator [Salibacteraceae bacterium]
MSQQLQAYIEKRLGQTPENLEVVLAAFKPIKTKKNQVLLEVGEVCKHCYFILNGCLKVSSYNVNGDESTINLAFEEEWRTAMNSFVNQQPSNERIVAVEQSELLAISRQKFQEFSQQISGFQQIYQQLLEESYTKSVERVQTLMAMDALDRLKWLLSEQPLIFTRLSSRLIASYLGISEATLSRLKPKL